MRPFLLARAAAVAIVVARLAPTVRSRPRLSTNEAMRPSPRVGSISVVIPARNEAGQVGETVRAVLGAPGVGEVIVVDDGSTDATADVARAAGARVVIAGHGPSGWTGKCWAVECGVLAASGEWVVTFDADTRSDPGLPVAVVARAAADRFDLVTVAGRFAAGSAGARWLHASMLTTLVYRYGAPGATPHPTRPLANGQCMVFRRQTFLAWGGFGPVSTSVVEDVALARYVAGLGNRVAFLDGSALLEVVSYPSFGATWRGWGRSLGLPGLDSDARRVIDVLTLAFTMPVPLGRLLLRRCDVVDLVALAVRAGTLVGTRRAYERHGLAYWSSPLADAAAVAAVGLGGFRRRQTWRGRVYETRGGPGRTAGR